MTNTLTNYYESYDEEGRLFRNHCHSVERLTTLHYMNSLIPEGSRIYDGCAGTGSYAFELARAGHRVTAGDIVPHNVAIMEQKQRESPILDSILVADICSLSRFSDEAFDTVLCMGAFYHLKPNGRKKAMMESLRILKKGGLLFVTYINGAAAVTSGMMNGSKSMDTVLKEYETGTPDGIFRYSSASEMEQTAEKFNVTIVKHIACDGTVYLHGGWLNQAESSEFEKYMQLHFMLCEDSHLLGYSLHGLIILQKNGSEII